LPRRYAPRNDDIERGKTMSSSATRKASIGGAKPTPVYIYFQANAEAFFENHQQAVDFFKTEEPHQEKIHGVNRAFNFSSYFEKNWQGETEEIVDKGLIFYIAPSIFGPSDGPNQGEFAEDELKSFVETLSGGQQNYRVVVVHFNLPAGCTQNQVQFDSADYEFESAELKEKEIIRVAITARKDFKFDDVLKHKVLECLFSLDSMSSLVHSGWFKPAMSNFATSLSNIFSRKLSENASAASQYFTKTPAEKDNRTTRCSLDPRGTIFKMQVLRNEAFENYSQQQQAAAPAEYGARYAGFYKQSAALKQSEAASASGAPGLSNDGASSDQG
jgi:hypothetical protein